MKKTNTEYVDTNVVCSCGNKFTVKSNRQELHLETCDKCHPFYTNEQGNVARTGKVEKFNRKYGFTNENK